MVANAASGLRRALKTDHWIGNVKRIGFDKESFSGVAGT